MTIQRLEHIGVVVDDIEAATAFFVALGMECKGETEVEGDLVDRIVGLEGVRSQVVMLQAPDGSSQLELAQFHSPPGPPADANAPSNATGLRHVLFQVDDIDAAITAAQTHGGELVGTLENYADIYKLCYVRGPSGIIVEFAEKLG